MPNLLTDTNGIPVPQYLNDAGSAYEAMRGVSGGIKVHVTSIADGDNTIGRTKNVPMSNAFHYLAAVVSGVDAPLWTPSAGKYIVLKGIRLQNLTKAVGSYASGLGSPDLTVVIKVAAAIIAQVKLTGLHIISDTTNHVFMTGGDFSVQELLFNDGIKLPVDAVLSINADGTALTATAWGYEE